MKVKKVIKDYLEDLDELNILTVVSYLEADEKWQEDIQSKAEQVTDDILSFLILAYKRGIEACEIMLGYDDILIDTDYMMSVIYRKIEGKTFEDRIMDHVINGDVSGLRTLSESEYHRVYNEAIEGGTKQYIKDGNNGADKTWRTVGDDRVRETHEFLEGVTIPFEEEFYTIDGDHAPYPGGFKLASNNVNCRCVIVVSPFESTELSL